MAPVLTTAAVEKTRMVLPIGTAWARLPVQLLLLATVICAGCREPELPPLNAGITVRPECPPEASDTYFFPEEALVPQELAADRTERHAFSLHLRAAKEVSLSCGPELAEGYRVIWGGGYRLPLLVGSIVRSGSDWRVTATEFVRPSDLEAYAVARSSRRTVDTLDVAKVAGALDAAAFWTTPVWREVEGEGTIWRIEARQHGRYRAVTRIQPDPAFASAAHLLLRLTGMPIPERMRVPD